MKNSIVQYKKHYSVFIKWLDDPIQISNESWEAIQKDLIKNPNWFIQINWSLYNKFEILKVDFYEEKLTEVHIKALQKQKQIEEKKKELGIY